MAQSQFVEDVFRSGFASVVIIDLPWVMEVLRDSTTGGLA